MGALILKIMAGILTAIIAHRIVSFIIFVIIGFSIYLFIYNPKLLADIINRIKDWIGVNPLGDVDASTLKSMIK